MTIQACLRILELDHIVHADQIHRAYRRLVKRWHPDQFAHQPAIHAQAEERLKRINQAYSILKEHLKKKPADHVENAGPAGSTPSQGDSPTHTQETPSDEPFNWRQWFKPKRPKERSKTGPATTAAKTEHRFKGRARASATRKSTRFEKVLNEAAGCPRKPQAGNGTGARTMAHPNRYKPRKRGMRIKGFKPVNPITPVRPVSRVSRIEGS